MDRSLLDKNVQEIDFTQLDPIAELRKINPRYMEAYDAEHGKNKIYILRAYDVQSPIEEALIDTALSKMEPVKISVSEESKVRRQMAELAQQGKEIDSPEAEAEWEAKLQNARMADAHNIVKIKAERAKQFKGNSEKEPENITDALSEVVGLGDKSLSKLNEAGIKNASEFHALSFEQKKVILGPLVAEKFKVSE